MFSHKNLIINTDVAQFFLKKSLESVVAFIWPFALGDFSALAQNMKPLEYPGRPLSVPFLSFCASGKDESHSEAGSTNFLMMYADMP